MINVKFLQSLHFLAIYSRIEFCSVLCACVWVFFKSTRSSAFFHIRIKLPVAFLWRVFEAGRVSKAKDVVSFEKIETVPISSKHFHAFLINEKKNRRRKDVKSQRTRRVYFTPYPLINLHYANDSNHDKLFLIYLHW